MGGGQRVEQIMGLGTLRKAKPKRVVNLRIS